MAFAYTINSDFISGGARIVSGTYVSDSGSTGGDIYTGLNAVNAITLQSSGSSAVANAPAVNETMPKNTDGITIVTAANESGTWVAIGI